MKYIFCSFMFDDVEENVKNSKSPNSVSGHKFQMNMLNGLAENGCDIKVINTPRIRRYPDYKKIIFRKRPFYTEKDKNAISVGFINLKGLNYLTQIHSIYKELRIELSKAGNEKVVLLIFNTYPAQMLAIRCIKKKYKNVSICNVIGDIYGQYGLTTENNLHGKLLEIVHNKLDEMASGCDAFGLATRDMATALGVQDKPYVVIEGMYEVKSISLISEKQLSGHKRVFYAGALNKEYDIDHMLRAFSLIKDPSYEFILAGSGDAIASVRAAASTDYRIKYLGFITPKEVENYQCSSCVLINPRTSEHQYVKYSFASKTLECLASGVPYVAHKLPCNPEEYSSYIIYPDDESDQALADAIQKVSNMSLNDRIEIGKRNREFIKQYKNPKFQMSRLNQMLQSIWD